MPLWGEAMLFAAGFVQSFCMVPMAVIILRVTEPAFRGRVMGVRMLAVYGLPLGLLLRGPLVEHAGFAVTGTLYSLVGIGFTLLIAVRWRASALASGGARQRAVRRNPGAFWRCTLMKVKVAKTVALATAAILSTTSLLCAQTRRRRRRVSRRPKTNSAASTPSRSRTTSSTASPRPIATTPAAFASAGCRRR